MVWVAVVVVVAAPPNVCLEFIRHKDGRRTKEENKMLTIFVLASGQTHSW